MKLLKDITTIFIILFTSIITLGAIVVLFKAIFCSLSNLFVCIVLVLVVSVVCSYYSYGGDRGFKELAVLKFPDSSDNYELTYDTEITGDVIGHLTDSEVNDLIARIEALKAE